MSELPRLPVVKDRRGQVVAPENAVPLSHDHLALQFAEHHEDTLVYCGELGGWLTWDGTRWELVGDPIVWDRIRPICREAAAHASSKTEQRSLSSAGNITAIERLGRGDPRFARRARDFDADLEALNTPDGVVDLRTGELSDPDPRRLCTRITTTAPAPSGTVPARWLQVLEENAPGVHDYLQIVFGLCLSGRVSEHVVVFLWGEGGNGKSLIVNVVKELMGGYAEMIPASSLMASAVAQHPTDLAGLRGARLALAAEIEDNAQWATSRIKQMTGGDPIKARYMRQDFFEYQPQFTLICVGNQRPRFARVDLGIRRRFQLVPFTAKIAKDRQVPDLGRQLVEEEGPAILRWMVDGYQRYVAKGLTLPDRVTAATDDYLEGEDHLGQWLEHCTRKGERVKVSDAYESWRLFCAENGIRNVGRSQDLSSRLADRGFERKSSAGRWILGLNLTDEATCHVEAARAAREERRVLESAAIERIGARIEPEPVEGADESPF